MIDDVSIVQYADKSRLMKSKPIVRAIAIILMAFLLYTQIIWAFVASHGSMQKDPVVEFIKFFPAPIRNIWTITYSTLICSVFAILFSLLWLKRSIRKEKLITLIFLILAILITLLTFFQLL